MKKEVFPFTIHYDKDIQHNYLVFETSTDKFDEEYYQVKMILDNNIEGLLKMDIRCNNDKILLNYYITSKQTLSYLMLNKSITFNACSQAVWTVFVQDRPANSFITSSSTPATAS